MVAHVNCGERIQNPNFSVPVFVCVSSFFLYLSVIHVPHLELRQKLAIMKLSTYAINYMHVGV